MLFKTLGEQLDQRITALMDNTRTEHIDVHSLAKMLGEQLDQRITALIDSGRAESIDAKILTKTFGEQFDQRIAVLINNNRTESTDTKAMVKTLGEQLDQRITTLFDSHAASNKTPDKLADEVRGLTTRFEHAIAESNAKAISDFDHRIATLIDNSRTDTTDTKVLVKTLGEQLDRRIAALTDNSRTELNATETLIKKLGEQLDQMFTMFTRGSQTILPEIATQIRALSEKLDRVQLSQGDTFALGSIEDRIVKLAGKLDASDAWVGRLGTIERGIAYMLARLEEQRRNAPQEPRKEVKSNETAVRAVETKARWPADTATEMRVELSLTSSLVQSPPWKTVFTTATSPEPASNTINASASESAPLQALDAVTETKVESPHPQVRQPINPSLTPDTLIESTPPEISQPHAAAADCIVASGAVLDSTKSVPNEGANQFEALIAARLDAFTAEMESTTSDAATFNPVTMEGDKKWKDSGLGSYWRWLRFADRS